VKIDNRKKIAIEHAPGVVSFVEANSGSVDSNRGKAYEGVIVDEMEFINIKLWTKTILPLRVKDGRFVIGEYVRPA
jgi:hypothetical protein